MPKDPRLRLLLQAGAVVLLWLAVYLIGIDIGKTVGRAWFG